MRAAGALRDVEAFKVDKATRSAGRTLRAFAMVLGLGLSLGVGLAAGPAGAADATGATGATGATVFAYQRFGDDFAPGASVRLDQFEAHLQGLAQGGYAVRPLPDIVAALRGGKALPERTVAITIDGTAPSVYREAFPRLKAARLPFTLFLSPAEIDRAEAAVDGWRAVREMMRAGATVGLLVEDAPPARASAELTRAAARFRVELGVAPRLVAYARGEYDLALRDLVEEAGFDAAFGQQSGVAHGRGDPYALPRFFMNEAYAGFDRFLLAASALPLPATDVTPADPRVTVNPPSVGFTVPPDLVAQADLACFASGHGRMALERPAPERIELRLAEPLPPGRTRINCTMPAGEGRWRWFGLQLLVPEHAGGE